MKPNRSSCERRPGFTLIEILVAIAIVGTLMALTVGAAVRYYVNARQRATEAVLQTLDNVLVQRFDSFWHHVKPPVRTRHAVIAGLAGPWVTNETKQIQLQRAMLLARLEAMRGDFPQQFADFLPAPSGIASSTDTTYADNVQATASRTRAAIEQEYRKLTYEANSAAVPNNNVRTQPTQIAPHNPLSESAACLYLMLKVGSGDGRVFDISSIPPNFVRDTDGDGVPEIVDSWGTPVRFYRWPTDLYLHLIYTSNELAGGKSNNQNSLDPHQLLSTTAWVAGNGRVAFEANPTASQLGIGNYHRILWTNPNDNTDIWSSIPTYPLIVSAGPDAEQADSDQRWQAFGYKWGDATMIPQANSIISWPPVDDTESRCAKVAQEIVGYPGAGAHTDNILSRTLRAGREAN